MWTLFFFKHWLFLCSTLTRFAQNDFLSHNVYVYFLCGLMCTWIHESVAELICMRFFFRCFNLLCYASGFYMLLFVVRCLWCARVRARVCVLFIGIVQRNWACLTWKSAIEVKSLLLLLLLLTIDIPNLPPFIQEEHVKSNNYELLNTDMFKEHTEFFLDHLRASWKHSYGFVMPLQPKWWLRLFKLYQNIEVSIIYHQVGKRWVHNHLQTKQMEKLFS